jgi:hypothetical protein
MKKRTFCFLLVFVALLMTTQAVHAVDKNWANDVEIVRLGQDGNNSIAVLKHPAWNNQSIFFFLEGDGAKAMLATALTALSLDKKINVEYSIGPNTIHRLRVNY